MNSPSHECKMAFLPSTCYSDFHTDHTLYIFHDLDTKHDLRRIMSGFHGAFARGIAYKQGTATLPDTWFRPNFGTCLSSNCWDQFSRSCRVFSRRFPLLSIGTFLTFLNNMAKSPCRRYSEVWPGTLSSKSIKFYNNYMTLIPNKINLISICL